MLVVCKVGHRVSGRKGLEQSVDPSGALKMIVLAKPGKPRPIFHRNQGNYTAGYTLLACQALGLVVIIFIFLKARENNSW